MLNELQIIDAINRNEIQISYYLKKNGSRIEIVEKDFSDFGKDLLDSNRLKITMGPIVRVLSGKI